MRRWAFKRRVMYGAGFLGTLALIVSGTYYAYLYEAPSCLDGFQNGIERGIDCGGACARICTVDVKEPYVQWVRSFKASEGNYNAVAYVENRNITAGVADLGYTVRLFDAEGLITERRGRTALPPGTLYPIFEGRIQTGERVPARATIEFDTDPMWVKAELKGNAYKTERRELKSADERPVLTATLRNETLDETRDVDVVATIFDSRGNPLTASRTKIPSFPGRATKEVTFTWQEPIAKTVRSCEVPTDVVLAIDLSGSMNNDGDTPPEPITSVIQAAKAFVDNMKDEDQVGVVTYATEARVNDPLTTDTLRIGGNLMKLSISPQEERGSTNTGDAILRAKEELRSVRHNASARSVFILLTDGLATAPGDDPEAHAREAADALKGAGIEFFTIGLGEQLNEDFLRALASDSAHYFRSPNTDTLGAVYDSITEAICEEGAAVIDIIAKPTATFAPLE